MKKRSIEEAARRAVTAHTEALDILSGAKRDKKLLSRNEALAILQEHNAPMNVTNREMLRWCVDHEDELPYTSLEIMRAFFPHNPQNIRDTL